MALADAVQGGKRPSQTITWTNADGTALDLTGATITARLLDENGVARTSDGSFVLVTPASGIFRWDYGTADVGTAGRFRVQFNAAFGAGVTPARSFADEWRVERAI